MRSYFFMGVSSVRVRDIALALLTRISMPPNCLTALSTAFFIDPSSLTSTKQGSACPPAASTEEQRKSQASFVSCFLIKSLSRILHQINLYIAKPNTSEHWFTCLLITVTSKNCQSQLQASPCCSLPATYIIIPQQR